ncbi:MULTISPECIES: adenosylcobalamin-dependent ribonucleoside-diphosphate reductase [Romboutsia]|uniref:adenosylcobalamin-dependent ribonucleoside-diphosphate reductase n=1 Tax=Romboutsia TaxID=1501226 RepID=UPI0018991F21|nr:MULTISPECIES: adenosylcobalamin-dependent ribonucleoside-diphosphate reductase [Romboutsia]MCH1960523.1 adenosylcobalamin-dependent ribonucleoside-diphosphate reductase [Romboutsia hominis]MCH1969045.1 adenosylcobalamin-dependent ribonucleoside-diphosphate reductase [Romboutsia hominis]MDB8805663.1 adenosylcobalamin-dependent ribonucleoside-diphosphate reductase [Romboutsia sp. 1001216sp1]MDB8807515.1 adenosylcobalamin-dependent ribonucleoside-diphosphate reductase [Romboutsia sp. 1001216sp1
MINIIKRDGTKESFDKSKIYNAIYKSTINSKFDEDKELAIDIANKIEKSLINTNKPINVEEIQDMVELYLMESNRKDVAKKYILYREKRANIRYSKWKMEELQKSIWSNKYQYNNESFDEWLVRVSGGNKKIEKLIREKKFLFAGRILANRGLNKYGIKVTYSNCYVLSRPKDNIESIFDTAKYLARTFSYGGGVGIDISNLRPRGSRVYNAAKTTTGAVSFMDLYSMTTGLIGQRGRRGALMISMDVNHPDIEEFIDIKTNLEKITKANISVRINDEFMRAVENKEKFICKFLVKETDEVINKEVDAYSLFMKLIQNNWDYAEPGILFWDNINKNHLLSEDKNFRYEGVNPCAEEPLPAGGSCLLGSINLAEFVVEPFTKKAVFDFNKFKSTVRDCVVGLNEVLEEGLNLHPLDIQKESVKNYRQIGLGVMGIADMLIKLNLVYGSENSINLCERLSKIMLNEALKQSAILSRDYGSYEKYDEEAVFSSNFFKENVDDDVKNLIRKYGLRNSQLLTIPPTGSISTMLGISGGIEPIFNLSYIRKTESLHDEDVYYKVYTPIVKEYMDEYNIVNEKDLPNIFVTAMKLNPEDRIRMQNAWQKHIDASISSTINLFHEATVDDVYNIYMSAWKNNLKGITIYRDGCKRSGILVNEKPKDDKKENLYADTIENEKFICPECKSESIIPSGGCGVCLQCGYSKCN